MICCDSVSPPTVPVETDCDVIVYPYLEYLFETDDSGIVCPYPEYLYETDDDVILCPYPEYQTEIDDDVILCPYPEYLYETDDMLLYVLNLRTCMKLTTMCYDCAASRTAPGLLQCQ